MVLLGIHFPTFHKTREYLEAGDAPGTFSPWKILASGAAAGAAGSVVSSPTELIRTKMQMVRKNNILAQMKGAAASGLNPEENYKGNWDCAKKIFRNHGLRGMYSGYLSTLLRDMQGYAWFFFGYEATVHYLAGPGKTKADLHYSQVRRNVGGRCWGVWWEQWQHAVWCSQQLFVCCLLVPVAAPNNHLNSQLLTHALLFSCFALQQVMGAGVMAGFGLWGSMFPIDTIKSKIQADSLSKPQFKGTIDCIKRSVQIEGYGGLWRGVTAALWRAIPVNAAIFLAVEGTRQLIADSEETVDQFVASVSGAQQEAAL
jgi:solute carrier family 25 carnitine/acylcarnitine transporter 20/29